MNSYATGGAMRRREEILRIIGQTAVHSQDELLVALGRRGLKVTQPTLSRDLRELGLLKGPSGYTAPGSATSVAAVAPPAVEHRLEQLIRDFVVSAEAAMNLVVVKTPPATAQPLASAVDAAAIDGAIGTIGGDDTIFVAFRTPAAASAFARRIHDIAGLPPARRRTRS
jgi:transcriptional regulator of arginine metabolism